MNSQLTIKRAKFFDELMGLCLKHEVETRNGSSFHFFTEDGGGFNVRVESHVGATKKMCDISKDVFGKDAPYVNLQEFTVDMAKTPFEYPSVGDPIKMEHTKAGK